MAGTLLCLHAMQHCCPKVTLLQRRVCVRACVHVCALPTNDCLVHTGRSQVAVLDNSAASKVAVLRGLSTMFWQTQLFFSLIWPGVTTDNPGVL